MDLTQAPSSGTSCSGSGMESTSQDCTANLALLKFGVLILFLIFKPDGSLSFSIFFTPRGKSEYRAEEI